MRTWTGLILVVSLCVTFQEGGAFPENMCYNVKDDCDIGNGWERMHNANYHFFSTTVGTRDMGEREFYYLAWAAEQYEEAIHNTYYNSFQLSYWGQADLMPEGPDPELPNLIWWPETWPLAPNYLGKAFVYLDDCMVYAFDIMLNDEYFKWGAGEWHGTGYTVCTENVILHELGHVAGLDHVSEASGHPTDPCEGTIMWDPPQMWGVADSTLQAGDIGGLRILYYGVPVSNLRAIGEDGSVRLEWDDACPDTCRYDVLRATRSTGPYVTIDSIEIVGVGSFEYVDHSVDWSRPYCYRLEGEQACAIPLYLPEPAQLYPPTNLTASDVVGDCGGAIQIEWSPSQSWDVDGYHIYRCISGMPSAEVYIGSTADSPFIDSTALTGVEYSYFAVAYNDGDELSEDSNHSICSSSSDNPDGISAVNSSAQISVTEYASLNGSINHEF